MVALRVGSYGVDFPPIHPEATEFPVEKTVVVGKGERIALNLLLRPDVPTQCRADEKSEICESGYRSESAWLLSSHKQKTFPGGDDLDIDASLLPGWLHQGFAQLVPDLSLELLNYFLLGDGRIRLSLVQSTRFHIGEPIQYLSERVMPILARHCP